MKNHQSGMSIRDTIESLNNMTGMKDDWHLTPVEEMLEKDLRGEILQKIKRPFLQMLYLLREYGFTNDEISRAMGISQKSIDRNIDFFETIKKNIERNRYVIE
jgi:DNA-directed RNA polymerase specialized sigma24 family protein